MSKETPEDIDKLNGKEAIPVIEGKGTLPPPPTNVPSPSTSSNIKRITLVDTLKILSLGTVIIAPSVYGGREYQEFISGMKCEMEKYPIVKALDDCKASKENLDKQLSKIITDTELAVSKTNAVIDTKLKKTKEKE